MGCINACICSGNCLRCNSYQKEEYVGQAEDLYDDLYEREKQRACDDLAREQEEAYYKEMFETE